MKIAIILISEKGLPVAQKLHKEFYTAQLVSTQKIEGCQQIPSLSSYMEEAFDSTDAFFFIGAMGICVRAIAPFAKDKHSDPAVICIDSTGHFVISVMSGHVGKANELTNHAAKIIGGQPVVTTQSDRTGLWALDTLADKFDWELDSISNAEMNNAISLFVNEKSTALLLDIEDAGTEYLEKSLPNHVKVYTKYDSIDFDSCELCILVSPFVYEVPSKCKVIQYVPKVLHLGVGLARNASPVEDVISNIFTDLKEHSFHSKAIASFGTIIEKKDEPVVKELEKSYKVNIYSKDELNAIEVPTPSDVVNKHMGTYSVSEAASILSANYGEILMPKRINGNYTLAVSILNEAIRKEGHVEIVGAGPGDPDLVSVRGRRMLENADLILYAGSLVPRELTLCAKDGATVRSSASLNLEEQFELMKEFYDQGKFVVRLHTGDPCIYGAIQEQMNFFDKYNMSYHITPGISSFQAAAAELKSQFTIPEKVQTIVLTRGEGRTPMPDNEKLHLLARSQSTMCIFLSAGIVDKVQEDLLKEYSPETPVAACYHLTWKDQKIFRGTLKDLAKIVKGNNLTLTTMIVVGEAIDNRKGLSKLYDKHFKHLFRK